MNQKEKVKTTAKPTTPRPTSNDDWKQTTTNRAWEIHHTEMVKECNVGRPLGLQLFCFGGLLNGNIGLKVPLHLLKEGVDRKTKRKTHYMDKNLFEEVRVQIPSFFIGDLLYVESSSKHPNAVFLLEYKN